MADNIPTQFDQAAFQQLTFHQMFCSAAMPVNLAKDVSINLAKVTRYGVVEIEPEPEVEGSARGKKKAEAAEPEYAPAIWLEGNVDPVVLTEEQNEIFRKVWGTYARIAQQLLSMAIALYPAPSKSASPAAEEVAV